MNRNSSGGPNWPSGEQVSPPRTPPPGPAVSFPPQAGSAVVPNSDVRSSAVPVATSGQTVSPGFAPSAPEIGAETPTRRLYERIRKEVSKVYVGQDELVMGTLVALFSGGHVLIESVPGLGKTLFVRTLGKILGCKFGRIQFTADLMPSDITGAPIFNMKTQEFEFRPGPVFTQLLLADEINRAPAKTHAALLEIMQEHRVTIDGVSHRLELPFIVLATQNPLESEGTYNLPEAQLDRFMFKLIADYPSASEEANILTLHSLQAKKSVDLENQLEAVTTSAEIRKVTEETDKVRVDTKLVDYINNLVRLTRKWPQFYMGASPRAGIGLMQASRTLAAFYGRDFVVPDDVVQIALPTLRHRVVLTAEAEVEGQNVDQLLTELIRSVEVPRLR
ncbi:MAG TPA: MoxR family ATPase [Pirellulaceae bacterium]|nr:MoxR family ATPase [Pirellulaceae bacterium]HMO91411.1 MoxR family ATPase [Pirellulaceae bacterium]HMP69636.1 MoxR family ATPase [Pirellulaceae bacterium]